MFNSNVVRLRDTSDGWVPSVRTRIVSYAGYYLDFIISKPLMKLELVKFEDLWVPNVRLSAQQNVC
jgi:hypothetical protein